jgi:hypothetical protein
MTSSSIHTLIGHAVWSCLPPHSGAILGSNPHLTSVSLINSDLDENDAVNLAKSTSIASIRFSMQDSLWPQFFTPLLNMSSLTHLTAEGFGIYALQPSDAVVSPSFTSLEYNEMAPIRGTQQNVARMLSSIYPLRKLHYHRTVSLNEFQPSLPNLQHLQASCGEPTLSEFRTFVSGFPHLTFLDLSLGSSSFPEGWGPALVSSCPHLTSLSLRADVIERYREENRECVGVSYSAPSIRSSDVQAIRSLKTLSALHLSANLSLASLQAIGRMHTLHSLTLIHCDTTFQQQGVQALSRLSALTRLGLAPYTHGLNNEHLSTLVQSLEKLEELSLQISGMCLYFPV